MEEITRKDRRASVLIAIPSPPDLLPTRRKQPSNNVTTCTYIYTRIHISHYTVTFCSIFSIAMLTHVLLVLFILYVLGGPSHLAWLSLTLHRRDQVNSKLMTLTLKSSLLFTCSHICCLSLFALYFMFYLTTQTVHSDLPYVEELNREVVE